MGADGQNDGAQNIPGIKLFPIRERHVFVAVSLSAVDFAAFERLRALFESLLLSELVEDVLALINLTYPLYLSRPPLSLPPPSRSPTRFSPYTRPAS